MSNINKPTVKKIEIDEDILKMFSHQGFKDLFWYNFKEAKKENPSVTQEDVFNMMNDKWIKVIGYPRYSCYDSFRQRLNK